MNTRNYYIKKLRSILKDDLNLEKLRNRGFFLLSLEERRLLNTYLKYRSLEKYKLGFIKSFIYNLQKVNEDRFLYYFNHLNNIFNLTSFKINKLNIENSDLYTKKLDSKVMNKPKSYSNDAYFTSLIESENYEDLNKYYDIEVIERDSNLHDEGFKK